MMKYILFTISLFACFGCFKDTYDYIETVSSEEFCQEMMNEQAQLIDVRTQQEYDEAHIDGARLIDIQKKDEFAEEVRSLNKNEAVLVYCRSGNRSEIAAKHLANSGFKKIIHLENGFLEWQNKKTPCTE